MAAPVYSTARFLAGHPAHTPDTSPEMTLGDLQQMFPRWLLMWSPWRQAYTAFSMLDQRLVLDDPNAIALRDRMWRAQLAIEYGRPVVDV